MDDIKVGEKLEFCGLTYEAREVEYNNAHPYSKCELCDLNIDGRKLCLNNACKCGFCFSWERRDDKEIIFLRKDNTDKKIIEKFLSIQKEIAQLDNLKDENERLKDHNQYLADANRKLMEQNSKYEDQLKAIYANINRAIKSEVYKYMIKK